MSLAVLTAYLDQDLRPTLIKVAAVAGALETIFVATFMISRAVNHTMNHIEVYLMPFAYLSCMGHIGIIIEFVLYGGGGRHAVLATAAQLEQNFKMDVAEEFLYLLSTTIPKLCILSLYLRIFTMKKYRYATYTIASILILNWLGSSIAAFTICHPFAFNWDHTIKGGHCGNILGAFRFISVPNIVTDVAMLVLPMPVIWHLQISRHQKLGLTLTFLTGSLGIVAAIVRFVVFFKFDVFLDPTYYGATTMIVTVAETGTYLIAACLPSQRQLFRRIIKMLKLGSLLTRIKSLGSRKDGYSSQVRSSDVPLSNLTGETATSRNKVRVPNVSRARSGFTKFESTNWSSEDGWKDDVEADKARNRIADLEAAHFPR